jgi:hypothetical protein
MYVARGGMVKTRRRNEAVAARDDVSTGRLRKELLGIER